jgi:CMP-N-acetylneuraminic acid synthetase
MNIVFIPVRCGSKCISRKNIKVFARKPMIAYTVEAAKS